MSAPIPIKDSRFDPEARQFIITAEDGTVFTFALGPLSKFNAEHIQRREDRIRDLLEANNRYLERARKAEEALAAKPAFVEASLSVHAYHEVDGQLRVVTEEGTVFIFRSTPQVKP